MNSTTRSTYLSTLRTFRIYLGILLLLALALAVLHYFYADVREGKIYWFDLDKERNVPTWFSGLLLLFLACASSVAFYWEGKLNREGPPLFRLPVLWLGIAFTGLVASLDEITILHENLYWEEVRHFSLQFSDTWKYVTQWQILFAPAILLLSGYLVLFFSNRFRVSPAAWRSALTGIGCWGLALFLEGVRQTFKYWGEAWYASSMVAEEVLEMAGTIFLLGSVISYVIDIALDLNPERRARLQEASPFLSRRATAALGVIFLVFSVSGAVIYLAARKQASADAPVPNLIQRAMRTAVDEPITHVPLPPLSAWFDDLTDSFSMSDVDAEALLRITWASTRGEESTTTTVPAALASDTSTRIVFLSLSDGANPARVAMGAGKGVLGAIQDVLSRRYLFFENGAQCKWLKLDIVQNVQAGRDVDLRMQMGGRSLFGLALGRQSGVAFLPEELVTYTLVDSKGRLRASNVVKYLPRRLTSPQSVAAIRSQKASALYRFFTTGFFTDGKDVVRLQRGHRLFPELSSEALLSAARSSGDYLTRSVAADGKFVYRYRPKTDRVSDSYNILRHAGTVYSMLELYEMTRDENLLESAQRALSYLSRSSLPCEAAGKPANCIVEDGEVKLGGNALALIAFSKYIEVTGDREYLPAMLPLARWIQNVQAESGEFTIHKQLYPSGERTDTESQYYPGEALLALTRMYRIDASESWLDTAEKGAQYLINTRDRGKSLSQLSHDHWLLYALNELYRSRRNPLYMQHASRIAQAIVQAQNRAPRYPDWLGSYYRPPRSTPTATRSEGLLAAYQLIRDFGDAEEAERILGSAQLGIRFQLQTQFQPESAMYLPNPQRVLGAFHRDLSDFSVRIDYVQHNISALLGLHRILSENPDVLASVEQRLTVTDFSSWIRAHLADRKWSDRAPRRRLNDQVLRQSFELGRQFILNNQKPEGNFNYEYNFLQRTMNPSDSEVRQAGTLWSVALMYRFDQTPKTRAALDRGLKFFFDHTQPGPGEGSLVIRYPGSNSSSTGSVALVGLSIIEYLRTASAGAVRLEAAYRALLKRHLDGYIEHLKFMRLDNDHFSRSYSFQSQARSQRASPYFDGETLLCLSKAARYAGRRDLVPMIEQVAMKLAKAYTQDAWLRDPDSDLTKGFFQWGCMAFSEYQEAGWAHADAFGDSLLSLAWWMIHVHDTLNRSRNTAYAYEGIIHAYHLARARNQHEATGDLAYTIDTGLHKLTTWQVGGPLQASNAFLLANPTTDPLAVGGIMNHRRQAPLRIDVTQHQMAAVMLSLRHVYGRGN